MASEKAIASESATCKISQSCVLAFVFLKPHAMFTVCIHTYIQVIFAHKKLSKSHSQSAMESAIGNGISNGQLNRQLLRDRLPNPSIINFVHRILNRKLATESATGSATGKKRTFKPLNHVYWPLIFF